jgi:dienelactone hydrolase
MIEDIQYEVAGRAFAGVLAKPAQPVGGVVVFHGGTGLGAFERARCEQLAAMGYLAFAPDLFGEVFRDRAHGVAAIGELAATPALLRPRVTAAWRVVADRVTATAAIGHCFGGLAALELARSGATVDAVASFHGGLATRAPATQVHARVLICAGARDPYATREQRAAVCDELTATGADWQLLVLAGAEHGFTIPGPAYHAPSDRRSWHALLGLFGEIMPPASESHQGSREG